MCCRLFPAAILVKGRGPGCGPASWVLPRFCRHVHRGSLLFFLYSRWLSGRVILRFLPGVAAGSEGSPRRGRGPAVSAAVLWFWPRGGCSLQPPPPLTLKPRYFRFSQQKAKTLPRRRGIAFHNSAPPRSAPGLTRAGPAPGLCCGFARLPLWQRAQPAVF